MLSQPWKVTRTHMTNQSTAKAAYAFPKTNRFKENHAPPCESFYNMPSSLNKQATGMGRGTKISMVSPTAYTPSPLHYEVRSRSSSRSAPFGVSRDKMKQSGGLFNNENTPAPGRYNVNPLKTQGGFTMYSKVKLPSLSSKNNPGPSHYHSTISLNSSGKYPVSNLPNTSGTKIGKSHLKAPSSNSPGPAHYQATDAFHQSGRYSNSKLGNSRCRTFSRSTRALPQQKRSPGPAAYHQYSQFGARR